MVRVAYPFRVKHGGKYYAPGEPITVSNAAAYVAQGAVELPGEVEVEEKPVVKRGGRPKKAVS